MTEKKIIFLDIDGVLQPSFFEERFKNDLEKLRIELANKFNMPEYLEYDKYDLGAVYYDWDKESVENLKKLIIQTGAVIVLSSNWRKFNAIDVLKNYFRIHDLDTYLIDYAPIQNGGRALEIDLYLKNNQDVEKFVILDDENMINEFPNNFVNTCKANKFIKEYLSKALKILKD